MSKAKASNETGEPEEGERGAEGFIINVCTVGQKSHDVSTGPLACPFARTAHSFTCSLVGQ